MWPTDRRLFVRDFREKIGPGYSTALYDGGKTAVCRSVRDFGSKMTLQLRMAAAEAQEPREGAGPHPGGKTDVETSRGRSLFRFNVRAARLSYRLRRG